MRNRVQSGRNTKNDMHAHLLGIDTIPTKNGQELVEKWVSELMTNF